MSIRSFLFVPGDSDRKLARGLASGADALILDLEDAVAPARKPTARAMVAEFLLSHPAPRAPELWVRVNPLDEGGLDYTSPGEGQFFVRLPGTHKLATNCWLVVGAHALLVEAFVCRQPDENREQLWSFLLQHNARMYGVSYSIDTVGDIYLTGRLPHAAVTADELDEGVAALQAAVAEVR